MLSNQIFGEDYQPVPQEVSELLHPTWRVYSHERSQVPDVAPWCLVTCVSAPRRKNMSTASEFLTSNLTNLSFLWLLFFSFICLVFWMFVIKPTTNYHLSKTSSYKVCSRQKLCCPFNRSPLWSHFLWTNDTCIHTLFQDRHVSWWLLFAWELRHLLLDF